MDYKSKITEHLTWGEALLLPSWQTYHQPSDAEQQNIIILAHKLEMVRDYLGGLSLNVLCWIRPTYVNAPGNPGNGRNYNAYVMGAPHSAHIKGLACDFTISTMTCDEVRYHLAPKLEEFDLRMEKKPGSGWVHLGSDWELGKTRYFLP